MCRYGAGFDWTPEPTNAEVEEDIRVETDSLRGEHDSYLAATIDKLQPLCFRRTVAQSLGRNSSFLLQQ